MSTKSLSKTSSKNASFLPGYFDSLTNPESKKRYQEKLLIIGGLDPYETFKSHWCDEIDFWPGITCVHIAMYLLIAPSPYTGNELLNYKSMDCYVHFLSGWVRDILVLAPTEDLRVVISKVNHSQRVSHGEKPLCPWVIAHKDGKIQTAHCDCMAGKGETCSHVAAMLWAIESGVRIRESMTVTQKKAYWVVPNGVKEVPYAPVREMKFIGKRKSKRLMSCCSSSLLSPSCSPSPASSPTSVDSTFTFPALSSLQRSSEPSRASTPSTTSTNNTLISAQFCSPSKLVPPPTDKELNNFFASLANCNNIKLAILSLVQPYNSEYIPESLSEALPMSLCNLFKPEYLKLNYNELLQLAHLCKISVSPEQVEAAESKTRHQSKSPLWYQLRTGRITASRFKAVSHTNEASPSISLIISICHSEIAKFTSKATSWGCEHEKTARIEYESASNCTHHDFKVEDCGLFIHCDYPFIGASPDGIVTCSCCGEGVCEIKCPYCEKSEYVQNAAAESKGFCLTKDKNGALRLQHDHPYYYQVQCQLFCTRRMYCDFIVWTERSLHVERIYPDEELWLSDNL